MIRIVCPRGFPARMQGRAAGIASGAGGVMRFPRRYKLLSLVPPLLMAAGCQQPGRVVKDLPEPLVGPAERPLPRRELPPPVERPSPRAEQPAEAAWIPAKGISRRWRYIVIHHSADNRSTPDGMRAWHLKKGWEGLGYHFVVGNGVGYPDGKVFVGERWTAQKHGAHARSPDYPDNRWNEHGIGICLVGNFQNTPPTSRQLDALANLVAFLCRKCSIPTSQIYTHGDVDRFTACPGKLFPTAQFKRRLAAASGASPVVRAASR